MPKYRKLHVRSTESWDINDMPDDFTRLLWLMLPLGLCREGRGVDNTSWIKSKIMPLRTDVTDEMIEAAMIWYTDRGMIIRYQVEKRDYFYLPKFHNYQGNTTKEAESIYPASLELVKSKSRVSQDVVKPIPENIDIESEYMNTESNGSFDKLNTAFINASGIPAFGIQPRDVEAGQRMIKAEITPEHVTEAVGILLDKKMTMVGLASVEKTAYNVKAQAGYEGKPGQSLEDLGYSSG